MKVVCFNKFWISNLSTPHCQSLRTQFLVYQYHHIHFHRAIITVTVRTEVSAILDLPTSRTQIFHEREARAVDFFYVFCGQLLEPEMRSEGHWESLVHFKPNFRQWHQLFEHRFFWQPHLTDWTIASGAGDSFVITGIHGFILPFLPSESTWLWQTIRTTHFIIVPNYHLIGGAENCFIKCSLCWWKPNRFRLIFFSTYTILAPWLVRYRFQADQ